jgi:ABC-type cobalamin/Fe3+-siderophores transport system ATPase subunit
MSKRKGEYDEDGSNEKYFDAAEYKKFKKIRKEFRKKKTENNDSQNQQEQIKQPYENINPTLHDSSGNHIFGLRPDQILRFKNPNEKIPMAKLIVEAKKSLQDENNSQKNGSTFALFGSSGSGKTSLLANVFFEGVYKPKSDYIITVFTESLYSNALQKIRNYPEIIVDSAGFDADMVKWMYQMNYEHNKKYNFVICLDDVINVKTLPVVHNAFLTYRNMNITSIVSLQYLKLCPLSVRGSIYFTLLMCGNSHEVIEPIVKAYMMMYLPATMQMSEKIIAYDHLTKNYCFFLFDNLNRKCYYVDGSDYTCREMGVFDKGENDVASSIKNVYF